jgi:hypothetical protein
MESASHCWLSPEYLESRQTNTVSDSDDMSQIEDDEDEDEEEEDDTEAALTVEIADDDDREHNHDDTQLRRTQIYLGDDHGHQIPISTSDDPDLDMDVDIGIGIELDTDADAEPSLGYLDGALSFIAAERERARWSARHGVAVGEGERKWRRLIGMYLFPFFSFIPYLTHAESNRTTAPPEKA